MIPSAVAREARENLLDYLQTTYSLTDERLEEALLQYLGGPDGVFRGPYVDVRLPFREARKGQRLPLEIRPSFTPYAHQLRAFERLHVERGHQPQNTLVTTGTGSGKTECFLYPLLDHCWREREKGRAGIKAILLYPMNALATDQARRFAKELWDDPRLKGKVKAGLYVGGKGSHKIDDREHLVDDRKLLRQSPPDILLTNYKMLDFLLLRPEDQTLWRDNGPDTLRYLVLDELHTYDGAQGSDVACLIRRLKARLETPDGGLCCVGTSATIGEEDEDGKQQLTKFAEEIFEERFYSDSVITEDRKRVEEALGTKRDLKRHPGPSDRGALETAGRDGEEWIEAQRALWFDDAEGLVDRTALGAALKRHEFLHQLLRALGGRSRAVGELVGALAQRLDWFEELESSDRERVLDSFLGLVSYARTSQGGEQESGVAREVPFLQVQVQLWMREVRGLQRILAEEPKFEWQSEQAGGGITAASDADDDAQREASLPMIRCRECGMAGLAAVQPDGKARLADDREKRQVGKAWLERSKEARLVRFGHGGGETGQEVHLCPVCLSLADASGCGCLGEETPPVLPIRLYGELTDERMPRFKPICPECDAEDSLLFVGSRSSSLMSVAVSHLYQTEYNEDRKLLAFVDSVQDASHRAGFFGARTYRFNLRALIQELLGEAGGRLSLDGIGERLLKRAGQRLGGEEFAIPVLLPEDLRQHPQYEAFLKSEGRGRHLELRDLLIERLEQEVTFEYGFSVRAGRSLEKTGCSTVEFPAETLERVVGDLAAIVDEEGLMGTLPIDMGALRLFVDGVLQRLRLRGGIHHPNLESYVREGGERFMLSRQRTPNGPIFGLEAVLPRFLQASRPEGGKRSAFDAYLPSSGRLNWYTDWANRTLGVDPDSPAIGEMIDQALRLLERTGIVRGVRTTRGNRTIWGLEPRQLEIVDGVRLLECQTCQGPLRVSADEARAWAGQPCTRFRCDGVFGQPVEAPDTFYTRIFRAGRVARVFPEEHTGLLERTNREGIEERFKQDPPRPDGPNLLVCTPTLEMGIDIGDLSAVLLCSVPPTTSNYLQRIGRAGRSTGNALCLTMATTRPHDLYFHADPTAMMSGAVDPPGCFLDAPEMLKRQFVAHAMDAWARQETELKEIPRKTAAVLQDNALFPARFLDYFEAEKAELAQDFLHRFDPESLSELAREALQVFAGGSNVRDRIEGAFKDIKGQRGRIRSQREKVRREREKHEQETDLGPTEVEQLLRELKDTERVLERLNRELGDRYPLNVLTDAGVLPNYAFPEPGVELESVVVSGRGDKREYTVHSYQRAASAAIRELAPFNYFYAEGRRVEVDEIDLGSTAQPLLETWRFCAACNHTERESDEASEPRPDCPSCGDTQWADVGQRQRMVNFRRSRSLSGRLEAATADDGEERNRKHYKTLDLIDVQHENRQGARLIESEPFGFELLTGLVLREINFGLDGNNELTVAGDRAPAGFEVCRDCGRVKPQDPPGQIRHQPTCRSKQNKQERLERVHLYRQIKSEAIRLLLPVASLDLDAQRASFRAALQLGLRRRFGGRAPHLQTKEMSEPASGGGRRNFLVLFDSVPGGTGFLADLWHNDHLMDVLELALAALQACPCQSEGRDGCYRCLFAYQSQRDLTVTSSALAQKTLKSILGQRAKLEDRDTLSNVSLASTLESELEEKFLRAVLHRARKDGSVRKFLENGEERWEVTFGEQRWKIVPQVLLGPADRVDKACKPDFVFEPQRPEMDSRKVAVFCDGFTYHVQPEREVSRIGDDLEKRRAVIESDRYLVWSITWSDVEAMEELKTEISDPLLKNRLSKAGAGVLDRWELSRTDLHELTSGELLFRWLKAPSGERWRDALLSLGVATTVQRSTLSEEDRSTFAGLLRESTAPYAGEVATEPVQQETGHFAQLHRSDFAAALATLPTSSLAPGQQARSAEWTLRLYDDQQARQTKGYEGEWRRFLQALNLLQFSENLVISSTEMITGGAPVYQLTPVESEVVAPLKVAESESAQIPDEIVGLELLEQELEVALAVHRDTGLIPEPVYEFDDGRRTGAQADLAWVEAKVAYGDPEESFTTQDRKVFEAHGWVVLTPGDGVAAVVRAVRDAVDRKD